MISLVISMLRVVPAACPQHVATYDRKSPALWPRGLQSPSPCAEVPVLGWRVIDAWHYVATLHLGQFNPSAPSSRDCAWAVAMAPLLWLWWLAVFPFMWCVVDREPAAAAAGDATDLEAAPTSSAPKPRDWLNPETKRYSCPRGCNKTWSHTAAWYAHFRKGDCADKRRVKVQRVDLEHSSAAQFSGDVEDGSAASPSSPSTQQAGASPSSPASQQPEAASPLPASQPLAAAAPVPSPAVPMASPLSAAPPRRTALQGLLGRARCVIPASMRAMLTRHLADVDSDHEADSDAESDDAAPLYEDEPGVAEAPTGRGSGGAGGEGVRSCSDDEHGTQDTAGCGTPDGGQRPSQRPILRPNPSPSGSPASDGFGETAGTLLHALLNSGAAPPQYDSADWEAFVLQEEEDEMEERLAEEDAAAGIGVGLEPSEAQTLKQLLDSRDRPIFAGARINVMQAAYLMLSLKREGKIKDNVFNLLLSVMNGVLLPADNIFPKSLYLMRRVIGCRSTEEVTHVVCPNDCSYHGCWCDLRKMPKGMRPDGTEKCPECKEDIYAVKRGKVQPCKTFMYFGVKKALTRLFADPAFVKLRADDAVRDDTEGYYKSDECVRLHGAAGVDLNDKEASVYDIGLDWGQVYDRSVHALGVLALRCADLPVTHRTQRRFCMPLAIIPGPSEPKNMWPYLQPMAREFAEKSMVVEPVEGRAFRHTFLLGGVYGDTPAQKKVSMFSGHSAYLGCSFCCVRGVRGAKGGMYFPITPEKGCTSGRFGKGERAAMKKNGAPSSTAVPHAMGDDTAGGVKYTHNAQMYRARAVDAKLVEARDVGCRGMCKLLEVLPYMHYNNAFPLPVAHAALQGVTRSLMRLTLDLMPAANKLVLKKRAGDLQEPADVGRRYKCMVQRLGQYTMEDLVNFVEFGSVRMLDGLVDDDVAEMWNKWRSGILRFLREKRVHGVEETVEGAFKNLLDFAKLLEQKQGLKECTYNLHILLCRLVDQEQQCGSIRQSTEFWVEMMVQLAKSSVRYRSTSNPGLVLAHDWIMDEALTMLHYMFPNIELGDVDKWLPHVRALQHRGDNVDAGDGAGNMLLGNGKPLHSGIDDVARAALRAHLRCMTPHGWSEDMAAEAEVMVHQYADLHSFEIVYSRAYTRAWSRKSHWVKCKYEEGNRDVHYIADVHFYILARMPGLPLEVRLAVADLYELRLVQRSVGHAWLANVAQRPRDIYKGYGVNLSDMSGKLVWSTCEEAGCVQFLEYGSVSGSGRFGKHQPMDTGNDSDSE